MTWTEDPSNPSGQAPEDWPADGLDRLIADAAREYHTPPTTVPREAMWAAIVAARPVGAPVVPIQAARDARDARDARVARRRGLMAVAAAAAIFLATGVGIGRWWGRDGVVATRNGSAAPASVAATPTPVTGSTPVSSGATDTPTPTTFASVQPSDPPVRVTKDGAEPIAPSTPAARTDPYDVAVLRHFAQAEALLVSYRADTVDVAMDARLARWARPLLGDTRLLLDSPAARDPRRRRLLEDLELVLAEVARLAPASADSTIATSPTTKTERQLIDGTLRRQQILPRLRTVLPAGA